jgi:hypothetical protein
MPHSHSRLCSRRHFLHANAFGLGSLALAWLLREDKLLAGPVKPHGDGPRYDLLPKPPHFAPKANAMISLFMMGGPSQMDLFDPKPMLTKYDGQKFPGEIKYDNLAEASAKVFGSPWKFSPRGQCGMELSELLPHLGQIADDITLIRSMHSGVNNHAQALYALNGGRAIAGRPALGSWLTYGLGSETQELPAYMVLAHPSGLPTFQHEHFTNGWLPSLYQGTLIRPTEPHILNLDPAPALAGEGQRRQLDLLRALNEEHLEEHSGELDLQARIASYELAAKMQTAAKEALDISGEPEHVRKMYGVDDPATKDYATRCITARRLVERGVRFVQVLNNGQSWDPARLTHHGAPFFVQSDRSTVRGADPGPETTGSARDYDRSLGWGNGASAQCCRMTPVARNGVAIIIPTVSASGSPEADSRVGTCTAKPTSGAITP